MQFRYDINALRAIAVLGVLLFHFKVSGFSGGFAGVDIFFVISGYLMTKITIGGIEKGNFNLAEFYGKRIKRIIPALLFLVCIVTIGGFFIYLPTDFVKNCKNAYASLLFLSNIFYWRNSNYFDPASDTNVFLHTWSLSVEWQFYLLYPLVLLLFKQYILNKRDTFVVFFTTAMLVLFLCNIWFTITYPKASFYLLPTRSWEMLLGGAAFFYERKISKRKFSKVIVLFSYLALAAVIFGFDDQLPWPGYYALVPVLFTFLIILFADNDSSFVRNTVVQYLGKISYSLYLWHWPIFVFSQYIGTELNVKNIFLMIVLSIGMADISYRFIETIKFLKSYPVVITAFSLCILTFCFSTFQVNAGLFKENTLKIANYLNAHMRERAMQFNVNKCFLSSKNSKFALDECLCIADGKRNVLLIGDSHGAHFSQSIREFLEVNNGNLLQANASGCAPILNGDGEKNCSELINYVYTSFLEENHTKIDLVILSANWVNEINDKEKLVRDLKRTIQYLEDLGIKVLILGQNETYTMPFTSVAAREYESGGELTERYINGNSLKINEFLKEHLDEYYVDIAMLSSLNRVTTDLVPYMSDENHYTKYGADEVVKIAIANRIKELL